MEDQSGTGSTAIKKRTVRGRWTAQQRQEIVEASLVAGASINEVAERYGVRPNLLTAWRRRHAAATAVSKPKASTTRFAAVRVKAIPVEGTIEIDLSSRLIRVRGIVDVGILREVLTATR
jgi:transposase-like protein